MNTTTTTTETANSASYRKLTWDDARDLPRKERRRLQKINHVKIPGLSIEESNARKEKKEKEPETLGTKIKKNMDKIIDAIIKHPSTEAINYETTEK